jgi:2-polyprenyl-3-methyl-5-hydroxy-6-metoxy-1,4-benzoquinol methylase
MTARNTSTRTAYQSQELGNDCRVSLKTDHPVAVASVDHLHPLGTMQDNFRSPDFTRKLVDLYAGAPMTVLDIGCSGGGFVKEVNESGHLAVGLEGSDYSLRHRRAEWATIPDRLFTCDCTKPFSVQFDKLGKTGAALFDVVTAWEFLEHIKTDDLPAVLRNVAAHLNPETGIFIASVNLRSCELEGHEYHATVQPEWWWRELFRKHGFFIIDRALDYFDEDWVRGPKDGQDADGTCHIVAGLRHDSAIVRRIDQAACSRFEHGRLGITELRKVASSALAKAESLETIISTVSPESPASLAILVAHAVARCRAAQWNQIALYGAGIHSTQLIPLWKSFSGPSIKAIVVSTRDVEEFHGIPVFELGAKLPVGVQAIVPSSHSYEAKMRLAAKDAYPEIPWVFLWAPDIAE